MEICGAEALIPHGSVIPKELIPLKEDFDPPGFEPYPNAYVKQWVEALPDWVWKPHTFFFLDSPFPKEWQEKYSWYFEFCMAYVRKGSNESLKVFVLETRVDDEAYVVDRGPMAKRNWKIFPDQMQDYANSRVLLREYAGGYELPEVIIPQPIAADRLISTGEVIIPDVPKEYRPKPMVIQRLGSSEYHLF